MVGETVGAEMSALPLVLLAGGKSSRLGSPKGLVETRGEPWIARQLARFAAAGGTRAIVVTGFDTAAYRAALPWFDEARRDGVDVAGVSVRAVENPDPDRGPFSSLACALATATCRAAPAVWVLPIDCPLAAPATLRALAHAFADAPGIDAVLPVHEGGGGHPVLLSAAFVAHLVTVPLAADDARLDRQLHARAPGAVVRVATPDADVRRNLNTKADWDAFGDAADVHDGGRGER